MPYSKIDLQAEKADFDQQVKDLKQWWATPRFEGIVRPYAAEEIAAKRGSAIARGTPVANALSEKLFAALVEHDKAIEHIKLC